VDGYGWTIIPPVSSNLDLVRSIYEPIEHGDYSKAEWADPEIEYAVVDALEPRTYTGLVGLAEAMRNLFSDIVDFSAEVDEYTEFDGDRVLLLTRWSGRGRKSGVPVTRRCAEVFDIHDGKVTKITNYTDRDRALADLNLTPEEPRDAH
jgi:ketosteroid isomerase-like protein